MIARPIKSFGYFKWNCNGVTAKLCRNNSFNGNSWNVFNVLQSSPIEATLWEWLHGDGWPREGFAGDDVGCCIHGFLPISDQGFIYLETSCECEYKSSSPFKPFSCSCFTYL